MRKPCGKVIDPIVLFVWLCVWFCLFSLPCAGQSNDVYNSSKIERGLNAINQIVNREQKKLRIEANWELRDIDFQYSFSNKITQGWLRIKNGKVSKAIYAEVPSRLNEDALIWFRGGGKKTMDDEAKEIAALIESILVADEKNFDDFEVTQIKWHLFGEGRSAEGYLHLDFPEGNVSTISVRSGGK